MWEEPQTGTEGEWEDPRKATDKEYEGGEELRKATEDKQGGEEPKIAIGGEWEEH